MTRPSSRTLLAALTTALALVVGAGAGPAAASGLVGVHSLHDTVDDPGAVCVFQPFDPHDALIKIRVTAPIVFARDSSSGVDRAPVAWSYSVLATDRLGAPQTHWFVYGTGPLVRAHATDHAAAAWSNQVFKLTSAAEDHHGYRVVVHMIWYRPGTNQKVGSVRAAVKHYTNVYKGGPPDPGYPACGTTLG